MGVIRKGSQTVQELPGSPRIVVTSGETRAIREFGGPTNLLLREMPTIGDEARDLPFPGLRVSTIEVRNDHGGLGRMIVEYSDQMAVGGSDQPPKVYEIEIEWQTMEKAIEYHPMFKDLTEEDRTKISLWESLPSEAAGRKKAFQVPVKNDWNPAKDEDWEPLSQLARKLVEKKSKGIESYLVVVPVIRQRYFCKDRPLVSPCGKRSDPPVKFGKYIWVRTSDRVRRDGRRGPWLREIEWTGFDELDSDLYPG